MWPLLLPVSRLMLARLLAGVINRRCRLQTADCVVQTVV